MRRVGAKLLSFAGMYYIVSVPRSGTVVLVAHRAAIFLTKLSSYRSGRSLSVLPLYPTAGQETTIRDHPCRNPLLSAIKK